jgi:ABC-2 type transport system permease protein
LSITRCIPCARILFHAAGFGYSAWQTAFRRLLFVYQEVLVIIWILAVVLLGMGGMLREKALGTSSFTLTLPVSRARLVAIRAAVGAFQSIALCVMPWLTVFLISASAQMPVSGSQVASYMLLLAGGGMVYFATALLISCFVFGEYTAPALAFGVILLAIIGFGERFREYDIWRLVTADFSIDKNTFVLSPHLPWLGISASLAVAALFFVVSLVLTKARDF